MAHLLQHRIFRDIVQSNLELVQQRVLADAAVLEERNFLRGTPLICSIYCNKPAIALWLIQHRSQHDVNTADRHGRAALHHASKHGMLDVVQALVAAGANPAAFAGDGSTPLILASISGRTDTVAFLLQLPAVRASIDHINQHQETSLSTASKLGYQPIVQLLLDAGADPTVPPGHHSPLNRALSDNHHAVAAILRHAIAEPDRVRNCVSAMSKDEELGEDLAWEISTFLLPAWATKQR